MIERNYDRIECVHGDITTEEVDAIVNAASRTLRGGGGVDGAIHIAAGFQMMTELVMNFPEGCQPGQACMSGGYELPARHVIHTVGPVWHGGTQGEPALLSSCYRESLRLAAEAELATVSLPAVSCGVYGYPVELAAEVAIGAIGRALAEHPGITRARMVLFSEDLRATFQSALDHARA